MVGSPWHVWLLIRKSLVLCISYHLFHRATYLLCLQNRKCLQCSFHQGVHILHISNDTSRTTRLHWGAGDNTEKPWLKLKSKAYRLFLDEFTKGGQLRLSLVQAWSHPLSEDGLYPVHLLWQRCAPALQTTATWQDQLSNGLSKGKEGSSQVS